MMGTTAGKEKPVVLVMDDDSKFLLEMSRAFALEGNELKFPASFEEFVAEVHEDETRRIALIISQDFVSVNAILAYTKSVAHRLMAYVLANKLDEKGKAQKSALLRGAYEALDKSLVNLPDLACKVNYSPVWKLLKELLLDHMTGLDNELGFLRTVKPQLETMRDGRREGLTISSILVIDADKFKTINDTYGHIKGDEAIKVIADALRKSVRPTDHLCRKSGDEFFVWLRGANKKLAKKIGRKLKKMVSRASFCGRDGERVKLQISFGAAQIRRDEIGEDTDTALNVLIERADTTLTRYKAARGGVNRR